MSHERAFTIRQLAENDLHLAPGIDVSEDGQSLYRYIDGALIPSPGTGIDPPGMPPNGRTN
jgi:hypothetical protein